MDENMIRKLAEGLGLQKEEFDAAVTYKGMIDTSLRITALVHFVDENKVFTVEVRERFKIAVKKYLEELQLILDAQTEIERLREEF
jgi:hypothetical protein